jgi:hypothetical protein
VEFYEAFTDMYGIMDRVEGIIAAALAKASALLGADLTPDSVTLT